MVSRRATRIAFDLDGTLADFTGSMIREVKEREGIELTQETLLKAWDECDTEVGQAVHRVHEFSPTLWADMDSLASPEETARIQELANDRHSTVLFMTYRPTNTHHDNYEWLQRKLGIKYPILLSGAEDKGSICRGMKIQHHIDDRWFIAHGIGLSCPNTTSYLVDRAYNQEHNCEAHGIVRVNNLTEFLDFSTPKVV